MVRPLVLTGPPRLRPADVRKRARSVPNCSEIRPGMLEEDDDDATSSSEDDDDTVKVLSFLVEGENSDDNTTKQTSGGGDDNVARINVYYQTGTVATCRVLNGQVRQTLQRRCTLDAVERILRDPPRLTRIDATIVADDVADTATANAAAATATVADSATRKSNSSQEERILRRDIDLADTGLAIMAAELDWLQTHAALLEEAHVAASAKKGSDTEKEAVGGIDEEDIGNDNDFDDDDDDDDVDSVSSDREYEFHLPEATVSDVEQFLADSVSDPIRCVAINGMGAALIYRSGEWAYTSDGLSKKLKKALNECKETDDPPRYMALGTEGRYFLSFSNGLAIWNGPGGLDKALTSGIPAEEAKSNHQASGGKARRHNRVSSVAFGRNNDTWFVVFRDGSWEYRGRSIPEGLESILTDRGSRADLDTVTLGPGGEWFLKARNGKMWWGGASEGFDELMEDLEESGRIPRFVDFGDYGSYFVTHE